MLVLALYCCTDGSLYCCGTLQAQQQLSRLQAAADSHASNVAERDAFVRSTAQRMGITLPGEPQQAAAAAAAGGRQDALPQAAVDFFKGELSLKEGQLQSELSTLRDAHRWGTTMMTPCRALLLASHRLGFVQPCMKHTVLLDSTSRM
jgi:hypothetical protein